MHQDTSSLSTNAPEHWRLLLLSAGSQVDPCPEGASSQGKLCRQAGDGVMTRDAEKGRRKIIGLLGTSGRLLLD